METQDLQDENEVLSLTTIEREEPVTTQQPKKVNTFARGYYGEEFFEFSKMDAIRDLVPQYKDFYYQRKIFDSKLSQKQITREFNERFIFPQNRTFFPQMTQMKRWREKWDLDILNQSRAAKGEALIAKEVKKRSVRQVIRTRDAEGDVTLGAPTDQSLEAGVRTLGGELLNDAVQMLKDDQELDEIYSDEALIRRRNYVVSVFSHVTKLVHGKAEMMLKMSQEKRENASFLMDMLAKATSGKLSDDEMNQLSNAYPAVKQEPEMATTQ